MLYTCNVFYNIFNYWGPIKIQSNANIGLNCRIFLLETLFFQFQAPISQTAKTEFYK